MTIIVIFQGNQFNISVKLISFSYSGECHLVLVGDMDTLYELSVCEVIGSKSAKPPGLLSKSVKSSGKELRYTLLVPFKESDIKVIEVKNTAMLLKTGNLLNEETSRIGVYTKQQLIEMEKKGIWELQGVRCVLCNKYQEQDHEPCRVTGDDYSKTGLIVRFSYWNDGVLQVHSKIIPKPTLEEKEKFNGSRSIYDWAHPGCILNFADPTKEYQKMLAKVTDLPSVLADIISEYSYPSMTEMEEAKRINDGTKKIEEVKETIHRLAKLINEKKKGGCSVC